MPGLNDVEKAKMEEMSEWVTKNLHWKFTDDTLNAVKCNCVDWMNCDHSRETLRRFDMAYSKYNEEMKTKIVDIYSKQILTATVDSSLNDEETEKTIKNMTREMTENIRTFKWIKRNISSWEMSQLAISLCGDPNPKDDSVRYITWHLKQMARFNNWEDKPRF